MQNITKISLHGRQSRDIIATLPKEGTMGGLLWVARSWRMNIKE